MRLSVPGLTRGRTCGDDGYVTVGYVASVGLSLVLFVMLANLVVFQYGRGVVRAALDEGVRAGARASDPAGACRARAGQVLGDLLGGTLGNGVRLRCAQGTDRVEADAEVVFPAWLPTVPDWRFSLRASARRRGTRRHEAGLVAAGSPACGFHAGRTTPSLPPWRWLPPWRARPTREGGAGVRAD